ncbi:MAG: urate oxidase [Chloroflexota bacterium]|nr:urate oxidase [Chloroflexota bacterium]
MQATIRYGKRQVTLYRTYAAPLTGLTTIPESAFSGRANTLFALEVDVEVLGDNFLPAYTQGDNSNVVATDSMKNFVLQQALAYGGATLEGFLDFLGRQFLATYPQMLELRLSGREQPFAALAVPHGAGVFAPSDKLFSRSHDDYAYAALDFTRAGDQVLVSGHECGVLGLQLIKLTGSQFTSFVRDGFTTLPERVDRPLFIYLDVTWRYGAVDDLPAADHGRYVAAEQVRDLVGVVFHEFVSLSIQHLVYEMGQRILARFPQLAAVSFAAQNRLWDTAAVSETDPQVKVYCDPRPPYGAISLILTRGEVDA